MRRQLAELRDQLAIVRRKECGVGELQRLVGEAEVVRRHLRPRVFRMERDIGCVAGSWVWSLPGTAQAGKRGGCGSEQEAAAIEEGHVSKGN